MASATANGARRRSSEAERLESVRELSRLRDFLKSQVQDCEVRLAVATDEAPVSSEDGDELVDEIEKKKLDVLDEQARQTLRKDILKMLLYSKEAFHSVYPELFPEESDHSQVSSEVRSSIKKKLFELHEINKKIQDLQEQKTKLRKRHYELDGDLSKVIAENEESMKLLHRYKDGKNEDKMMQECELKFPEVRTAKQEFENNVRQLKSVKYIFQSLIQASKLDWFEDKELLELMIKLGQHDEEDVADADRSGD